jgi:hypothetical protein
MSISKQEFTDAGKSMLGRAQAGEILTVTKIVTGSGAATQPSDLWPLTALLTPQMDVTISRKQDYGQGTLLIEGSLRSDAAPAAFYLKEVGVMAHIGAEADRLYSVANVFTDPPDYIDPASPTIQVFKIKLIIDRIPTASLVVQIGPSENVIGSNIGAETVGPGWYRDAAGNVLNFKRIIKGTGMEIYETPVAPGGNAIYVGVSTLHNNIDLYVPLTYPGISDPTILFPSIQAAHDYLLQFVIPTDKVATIHVAAGTLHSSTGTTFRHPNSKQIHVIGQPRIDTALTSIVYPANPLYKDCYGNTAGLATGQYVYLTDCAPQWAGPCIISGLFTGFVRCSVIKRDATAPYTINDPNPARLSRFPTVLIHDAPGPGAALFNCPYGINMIENLTLVNAGIGLDDNGYVNDLMIFSPGVGITTTGHLVLQDEVGIADGDFGIAGSGFVQCPYKTFLVGCACGVAPGTGGLMLAAVTGGMPAAFAYINHCQDGVRCFGSSGRMGSVYYSNNDCGLKALHGGQIGAGGSYGMFPWGNTLDCSAQGMSYIDYHRVGGAAPTCNPAAGVIGAQNSLIQDWG